MNGTGALPTGALPSVVEPEPITYLVDLSGRDQHLVGVRMRLSLIHI